MSGIYFISDLHLCAERPSITALFHRFMREVATSGEALYILGDLFEYWLGDDQLDHDPLARDVASTIATLADSGTRVYFIPGNRDFLIGQRFARAAHMKLLSDPTTIDLDGVSTLLMHGDTLCTDDVGYQQFRTMVRDTKWQSALLAKPYSERVAMVREIRKRSDVEKSLKPDSIMDVNNDAVRRAFDTFNGTVLIHGHTHRPAKHNLSSHGKPVVRWVLPDWHEVGGFVIATNQSIEICTYSNSG